MPLIFIFIFGLVYTILIMILYPLWNSNLLVNISLSLGFFTFIFWLKVQYTEPGFMIMPSDVSFLVSFNLNSLNILAPHASR
jgi:hypothetical protein